MSSSPTAATSTTASSSSSASAAEPRPAGRIALVACGALAQPAALVAEAAGWPLDVHPLNPLLHNRPQDIPRAVRELVEALRPSYSRVVVGYADCGTYGALDAVCAELGVERLAGLHCYDVYAGADRVTALLEEQPGTYLLTDFLVRSFARTVERELGLDRWPELRDDYFGSYTRAVWLAQEAGDPELQELARRAADRLGLPLEVLATGSAGLADELSRLVSGAAAR
ncbi:MAG TPA: DUF1638 domain-containing protein [Marmoricola sp.]|nr:DUF1638 domain-containing protein [Marmoricola sp.]